MKDEVLELKHELEEVKQESFALEILKDYKKSNKRLFITLVIVLFMWFLTIGYLIYILNDIGYEEEIIDIQDVEQIENSDIQIGDDLWEKSN